MNTFIIPEMPAGLKYHAKKKWIGEWSLRKLAHESGYTVVGEYTGSLKKIHMICPEGHDCYPNPNHFKSGKRCAVCAGQCPIHAEKDFRELAASEGWIIVGEYTGVHNPVHMICPEGHDCYPSPDGFKRGNRCRVCAEHGFNPDRCGYVYLYRWTNNDNSFLKYGITHNIDQRYKKQSRKTVYEPELVHARFFLMNGQVCIDKEKEIKTAVGTRYITKDILPDGHTETCPDTQENIDTIIGIIDQ